MPGDKKKEFPRDYVVRMYLAGYLEQFRHCVVKQLVARNNGVLVADKEGTHPIYRDKEWEKERRR